MTTVILLNFVTLDQIAKFCCASFYDYTGLPWPSTKMVGELIQNQVLGLSLGPGRLA